MREGYAQGILSGRGTGDDVGTISRPRPERYRAIAWRLAARPKENDEERKEAGLLDSKFFH